MQLAAKDFQLGAAVFAGAGVRDGAAESLRHCLKSVADPEHRHAEVEHGGIELRSPVGVDAGGSAGEHQRQRIMCLDLLDRRGVRDDLGINPRFSHASRDQLRILRTEVDHQHRAARGMSGRFRVIRFRHAASLMAAV